MKRIDQVKGTFDQDKEKRRTTPSDATVKRLPRYHRYLGRLIGEGILRISSSALAEKMGVTASQIRQDLACFGDFGQQGYGYNVRYLHHKISRILGLTAGHRVVFIGMGDAARALLAAPAFARGDMQAVAVFGGETCGDIPLYPEGEIAEILPALGAAIAVVSHHDETLIDLLATCGVRGVLNYSNTPISSPRAEMEIQNVYLDDPCLLLSYRMGIAGENED